MQLKEDITEMFDLKNGFTSHTDLLTDAGRFEDENDSLSRYFRLHAFQAVGAFDILSLPNRGGGKLTDNELDYLESISQSTLRKTTPFLLSRRLAYSWSCTARLAIQKCWDHRAGEYRPCATID
jgi:hypothetical protein